MVRLTLAALAVALFALVPSAGAFQSTSPPTISGTPMAGIKLTASAGTYDFTPNDYGFLWYRCPTAAGGGSCAFLGQEDSSTGQATYTPTGTDVGGYIQVAVEACTDPFSCTPLRYSTPVGPVVRLQITNTSAPVVSGVAESGRVLTGTTGTWTPSSGLTFSYAWQRCAADHTGCTNIAGATSPLYIALPADVGSTLRLVVTASATGAATQSAVSAFTDPVLAAPTSGSTDVDSLTPASFDATLHPGQSATSSETLHLAAAPAKADVVLALDTTGSMGSALTQAKQQAQTLISQLRAAIPGVRFAIADFQDYYPVIGAPTSFVGDPVYGVSGDHPYRLWAPLTDDATAVQTAINELQLGNGGDELEAYDRMFYEAYSDPNLQYDPQAQRFLVVLGDEAPHESLAADTPSACPTDGRVDPGRDSTVNTPDDLHTNAVVSGLAAAHDTLLFVTYNDSQTHRAACQAALAALTGGSDVLSTSGSSLAAEIDALIQTRAAHVDSASLSVEPSSFASWITFDPTGPFTNLDAPADVPFTETITPPADTAPGTYSFTVDAVADGVQRASQTVTVTVPEPPTVSISDASITEGGTATFTVSLSKAWDEPIDVSWSTADGTATAGADYTAASGTLSFAAGETTKQVTVQTTQDSLDEPDETFTVKLDSGAVGTGTILDDDPPPTISIGNASAKEGDSGTSPMTFTVSLSTASGKTVSVDWHTADGTATAGSDYTAADGTLTFAPGETSKQITVDVLGDTLAEGNETFRVVLSTGASGTGTIVDDDNRPPVCDNASVTPTSLWPVNHKFVTVTVGGCTDPDSDPLTYSIVRVQQDEPTADTPDAQRVPGHPREVQLRAERDGTGNGRVYVITFTVSDGLHEPVTAIVKVTVPHDQAHAAVDSGRRFDSF